MKALANALKGVSYHNPALGESLYELCRRATSRHIAGPDEIINQQASCFVEYARGGFAWGMQQHQQQGAHTTGSCPQALCFYEKRLFSFFVCFVFFVVRRAHMRCCS
jgi:hypothetical protein